MPVVYSFVLPEQYPVVLICPLVCINLFIHSPVDGNMVHVKSGAIIKKTARDENLYTSLCVAYAFLSPGYIPRNEIAGSWGKSMFNFTNNRSTVLQSGCTVCDTPIGTV